MCFPKKESRIVEILGAGEQPVFLNNDPAKINQKLFMHLS